jgi:hypothetical protein
VGLDEKTFEDILVKYPHLIEEGLVLEGRQVMVYGRRMDLLFKDTFGRQLIVELKGGPIKDEHIGQVMSYEGSILSHGNPDLRIMLVGTRVPPNIRKSLDHHGIAWKEISIDTLIEHLNKAGETNILNHLSAEAFSQKTEGIVSRYVNADQVIIDVPAMLIRINKTYRENMSAEELFEVTRGIWRVGPKREIPRYAFAVFKGVIKEVYRIDRWLPAGTLEYKHRQMQKILNDFRPTLKARWEFDGSLVEDNIRKRFVGKSCAHYFKQGNASPTVYVNC